MTPKILIAGIGNIFKADDAFGVEVVNQLRKKRAQKAESEQWPDSVEILDVGIRGLDLAYRLLDDGHELVVFVDTMSRGKVPGTLYQIIPDLESIGRDLAGTVAAEGHDMNPVNVLAWVMGMGGRLGQMRIVGCEPEDLGTEEDLKMGLTPAVQSAVIEAVPAIEKVVDDYLKMSIGQSGACHA
jgi:hydrogenase maturation protease